MRSRFARIGTETCSSSPSTHRCRSSNALTDREYPCRALADCLTLRDRFGELPGLQIAYVGACEPVTHSLIEAAMLSRITVRIAAPPALRPDPALLARAGSSVRVCETPREAVSGAAAVYAAGARRELPDAYTVTPELMSFAAPGAVVMHATPMLRDVLAGPRAGPEPGACPSRRSRSRQDRAAGASVGKGFRLSNRARGRRRVGDGAPVRRPAWAVRADARPPTAPSRPAARRAEHGVRAGCGAGTGSVHGASGGAEPARRCWRGAAAAVHRGRCAVA
jgi:hypothetical protein